MATMISNDKTLEEELKTKSKECADTTSRGNKKNLCFAEFLALLAKNGIFAAGAGDNDDDAGAADLASTCECLPAALKSMPDCGTFSQFTTFDEVIRSEQSCGDISNVCNDLSDFSKLCVDSHPNVPYTEDTCAAVSQKTHKCAELVLPSWVAGMPGAEYCGFKDWQLKRLDHYYSSCPPVVPTVSVFNVILTWLFRLTIAGFVVGLAVAMLMWYKQKQNTAYSLVDSDDFGSSSGRSQQKSTGYSSASLS
jgi:hypothetical protein